jgi:hypothetical protein
MTSPQKVRDLGAVELAQVTLDIAHAHAAAVERQDLLVEALESAPVLGHELRLDGVLAVAWHANLDGTAVVCTVLLL